MRRRGSAAPAPSLSPRSAVNRVPRLRASGRRTATLAPPPSSRSAVNRVLRLRASGRRTATLAPPRDPVVVASGGPRRRRSAWFRSRTVGPSGAATPSATSPTDSWNPLMALNMASSVLGVSP